MGLTFSANTHLVNHGSGSTIDDVSPVTLLAWVRRTADHTQYQYLAIKGDNLALYITDIERWEGQRNYVGGAGEHYASATTGPALNTWQLVAFVDGGAGVPLRIYQGSLTADAAELSYSFQDTPSGALIADAGDNLHVGLRDSGDAQNRYWHGDVAVFALVNAALTVGQIRDWQWRPRVIANTRLFTHYGWNGTTNAPDWSGNGNTGTVTGAAVGDHVPLALNLQVVGDWAGAYTAAGGAYSIPAASGSYALTGQTVGLKRGYPLAAASGSYSLTGQAATLTRGRPMPAASGTYSLTGQAAALRAARTLAIGSGAFAVAGQVAGLKHGYVVAATSGNYSLAGQSVTLVHGYTMPLASGAYALTGQSVTLTHGYPMPAASGTYTLTGQAAGLAWGHKVAIVSGTYTLTGQDVTLTYSGAGAKTLAVDAGAYTLTGQAAGLRHAYRVAAASGSFAATGQAAGLAHGYALQVAVGSYALAGQDATLKAARVIVATPGGYSLTGQDVTFNVGGAAVTAAFFFQRFVIARRG